MKSAVKAVSEIGKDFVFAPFQPIIQPIIHNVLKEHQKDKFRKGTILTPCVLVWLCFALVLRRNLNCKKVLDWLFSGFRWKSLNFTNHIVKDGTISHARLKMGVDVFRDIFNRFVSTFKDKATPDFYGWVTVMFDGVSYCYTANCHNLHFWTPTPTLPRWEREHKESADYARLQYSAEAHEEAFIARIRRNTFSLELNKPKISGYS